MPRRGPQQCSSRKHLGGHRRKIRSGRAAKVRVRRKLLAPPGRLLMARTGGTGGPTHADPMSMLASISSHLYCSNTPSAVPSLVPSPLLRQERARAELAASGGVLLPHHVESWVRSSNTPAHHIYSPGGNMHCYEITSPYLDTATVFTTHCCCAPRYMYLCCAAQPQHAT